jgi:hypothetical protein
MEDRDFVTVDLGDGVTVLAEVDVADPEADVSITDRLPFEDVGKAIDAISQRMLESVRRAKPRKATVEFGVAVGVEAGQLTALLVKGQGTATLKIMLEWTPGEQPETGP